MIEKNRKMRAEKGKKKDRQRNINQQPSERERNMTIGHTLKMIAFLALLHFYVLMLNLLEFYKAELSIPCTSKSCRFEQLQYEVNRKIRSQRKKFYDLRS